MPELIFKGKEFVHKHHVAVPVRPLVPEPAKSIGPARLDGNLVIHGNNFYALKALLPLYTGRVDCVFIDPPYNTGNEGWSYNDNVNSPMLRAWLDGNAIGIEDGLRHDKWLAIMLPRLELIRELMSETGSLWVTLDDNEPTGMVLWVVPNDAIYRQTKRHLSDRQHPYRQVLDRMTNGRVRILEKADTLRREDAEGALCVMLLMLASAARDPTTNLKLFQDRGDVHGFVPVEADGPAHRALLERVPNLDHYGGGICPQIKDSMGNALRLLRPVVVLDEGHRGTTDIAHRTLYGFNPHLVMELTATPRDVQLAGQRARTANVLVDIAGTALHAESMIKWMPPRSPRRPARPMTLPRQRISHASGGRRREPCSWSRRMG